ncbi:MAG: 2OG-Fe dioxygenase family protein [Sulfuriferula sp.]|nr:2OG-Fe dioxygenase family protein [Sulfuriferula sp.]
MNIIPPTYTPLDTLTKQLQQRGYAVLNPAAVSELIHADSGALDRIKPSWHDLPTDQYLRDGGRYRQRRHASFIVSQMQITTIPHRAHWQPVAYNALHGGMERMFAPIAATTLNQAVWTQLLSAIAHICDTIKGKQTWYVEAHQFRIDTTDGIGRPTPEGAHRDGVDFVAILLIAREQVKGGETRVFAADSADGQRFTLLAPYTLLILDDERVIHETTPIQPLTHGGYRDTLVLTFRADGFQEDNINAV